MKSQNKNTPDQTRRRKRKWKIIVIVLGVLLCIRIAMPYVILHYANQKLATLDGYYGHIEDIDLMLYRGAYAIKDIYIKKVDEKKDTSDFFACPKIDLSVEWSSIFEKKLVGEVEFEKPVVKYILGKNIGEGVQEKDSVNFLQLVRDFMPLRINHFAVHSGEIHYMDFSKKPTIDMPMTNVEMDGKGLTNEPDSALLPATIKMTASLYNGEFTVNTKLDPLNDIPTFDLNATLTNTDLIRFNDFFKAYGNFDMEKGSMALYIELAAKEGEFAGYVKPLMTDLKVLSLTKQEGNIPQIAWEALVGGTVELVTNQSQDQLGTKVTLSGKFKDPKVGVVEAILTLLHNAFIQALRPSLDNTITIGTVDDNQQREKRGFIDRLFNRDEKDKKRNRKKNK